MKILYRHFCCRLLVLVLSFLGMGPGISQAAEVGAKNLTLSYHLDEAFLVASLARAGTRAEEALQDLSWSEAGIPVPLDDQQQRFLFVLPSITANGDDADWALAGDFNAWTPVPMIKGDGVHYLIMNIADAAGKVYKFVNLKNNSWQADTYARHYRYDNFGEYSYVKAPRNAWYLERWRQIGRPDKQLLPRDLVVYIPAGAAHTSLVMPRPVLYMHDGQNLFDPGSMWGGWKMQEALQMLAEEGRVVPYIVGIFNTSRRMNEYTHIDDLGYPSEGKIYADLIQNTIRPFIEGHYQTAPYRGVMGSSLGGLISIYQNLLYPGEYQFIGALSPSLFWGESVDSKRSGLMLNMYRALAKNYQKPIFYLDSGGGPGSSGCHLSSEPFYSHAGGSDNYCETREFADAMANEFSFTWNTNLYHWWAPNEPHNEEAWSRRVLYPLQIFSAGFENE